MAWFWKNKGLHTAKPKKLSWDEIQRLRKIGDDFADFMAKGQRKGGAVPSKLLNSATLGEIRAGLIEHLMFVLSLGAPFEQQIKWLDATQMLFCFVYNFDTPFLGGERENESEELKRKTFELWDAFQDLIIKDEGRRFEVNEWDIREKIVVKLIQQTK